MMNFYNQMVSQNYLNRNFDHKQDLIGKEKEIPNKNSNNISNKISNNIENISKIQIENNIILKNEKKKMNHLKKNAKKLNQDLINQNQRKNNYHMTKSADRKQLDLNQVVISPKGNKNNSEEIKKIYNNQERSRENDKETESDISPEFTNINNKKNNIESEEMSIINNLDAHVHFSFKEYLCHNMKEKLKNAITNNLKNIKDKMDQIKDFKIVFNDSKKNSKQFENQSQINKSSKKYSLSPDSSNLDTSVMSHYHKILFNVLENSVINFNESFSYNNYQTQTIKTIHKLLKTIPFNTALEIKNNFFKIFNIQIPIKQETFNLLSISNQIKIYIYFFGKHFNRKNFFSIYESFMPEIDLVEIMKTLNNYTNINYDNRYYIEDPDIYNIFNEQNNKTINMLIIKKTIICIIQHLTTFHDFIKIKSENSKKYRSCKNNFENLKKIIYLQELGEKELKINTDLLQLPLNQLIKMISIQEFQLFISISNVDFLPKRNSRVVSYLDENENNINFELSIFEREFIFCSKVKRKDEKIKFVFKSIRKQLYILFSHKHRNNIAASKLKQLFNDRYLNGNKKAIKYFYSNDISQSGLMILKNFNRLIKNIRDYKDKCFISDQLEICVFRKSEDFLVKQNSNFNDFFKMIFDRQSKHTWILQDILNSLPVFEKFFDFRIKSKRIYKPSKIK